METITTDDREMYKRYIVVEGDHCVIVTYDVEFRKIDTGRYINGGETSCGSKQFKTLTGAFRASEKWLLSVRH